MKLDHRESWIILGFQDGVLWNYTHDFEQATHWLETGLIETFGVFRTNDFYVKED